MATLASVRAGCVVLIAGQFPRKGQKISQCRIHLQNLWDPDSFSCAVKIWANLGSAQNTQLLDGCFAMTELLELAGVDSFDLVGQERDRSKTTIGRPLQLFSPGPSRRCQKVSLSPHWKFLSYGLRKQYCPSSWGLLQILQYFICLSKSGLRDNEKRFLGWILLMNFCMLTCSLSSSQTCKTASEKRSVRLMFLLSVSKTWCHQDKQTIQ